MAAIDKKPRESLSRERIEVAALDLIEADGLAAFSTRRLATALGCEAMSIYHYFPSKGHLMDALVDRVVGNELTVLDPVLGHWRSQVEISLREWRDMALKHRSFFSYLALHRFNTPTSLRWLNGILGLMGSLGLPPGRGVRLFRVIGYYVNGAMMDETAGYSRGPSTIEPVPDEVMQRDYPEVVKAGRFFVPEAREETFEVGLRILLDGLENEVKRAEFEASFRR